MIAWHRDEELLVEQVVQRESSGISRAVRRRADHRHVRVSREQPLEQHRGPALHERDDDRGIGIAKGGECARNERRDRGRECADAQLAAAQTAQCLEIPSCRSDPVQDRLGMGEQGPSRLGKRDTAGEPIKEEGTHLGLQDRDLSRHGRLGVTEWYGRAGDRAMSSDRAEHRQKLCLHVVMLETHGEYAEHSLVALLARHLAWHSSP